MKLNLRVLTHVSLMVGTVVGVLLFTGTLGTDGASGSSHAHLSLEGGLLTTNRASLRVCVELAPSLRAHQQEIASQLNAGMQRIQGHKDWAKGRYGGGPFVVEHGCPGAVLPTARLDDKATVAGPGVTTAPSQFRTFVYVLDDATADVVLGERNAARAPAELMRVDEHTLAEVSSAVFVRESYLASESFTDFWLTWGVGLQPAQGFDSQPRNETTAKYPDGKAPAGIEQPK